MQKKYKYILIACSIVAVILVIIVYCLDSDPLTVQQVKKNPDRYVGRTISLKGTVKTPYRLFDARCYQLADSSASVIVLPAKAGVPAVGQQVEVRGTLHQPFVAGRYQLLVLEEHDNY